MYFLIISALLFAAPISNHNLTYSLEKTKKASDAFSEIAVKLYSIIDSEDKILDLYRKYEKILNLSQKQSCDERLNLIRKIKKLGKEYNLSDLISVKVNQAFSNNTRYSKKNQVRIKNYDIKIKFSTTDFATFLKLIKEIYSISPANSIIMLTQAERKLILDSQTISKLRKDKAPELIYSMINIRMREISAND